MTITDSKAFYTSCQNMEVLCREFCSQQQRDRRRLVPGELQLASTGSLNPPVSYPKWVPLESGPSPKIALSASSSFILWLMVTHRHVESMQRTEDQNRSPKPR